ncbi:MAG: haloacid dehalogenase type II [Thermodesulfobacteriota bacterium]
MDNLSEIKVLTFDVFGTILDLGGSLTPFIADFLKNKGASVGAERFWEQWRARQRIEQYQDTIMMLGHGGYLETSRRACVYTLALHHIPASTDEVADLMSAWRELKPFPEVVGALGRLRDRFKLVVLSNGEPEFLAHLTTNRIGHAFDDVISVNVFGAFKPHPSVYRGAARRLGHDVNECLMVSSNSFDVVGARACGYRAAFVDRYGFPYEDTAFRPDVVVSDFTGLTEALL